MQEQSPPNWQGKRPSKNAKEINVKKKIPYHLFGTKFRKSKSGNQIIPQTCTIKDITKRNVFIYAVQKWQLKSLKQKTDLNHQEQETGLRNKIRKTEFQITQEYKTTERHA